MRFSSTHRRATTLLTWLLAVGSLMGCEQMSSEPPTDTVRIDLFAPIQAQPALSSWPTRSDGSLRDIFALQRPHALALQLGERSFAATSQLTFLKQDGAALTAVTVQPPARPRAYAEVLTDLETLLRGQDLLTPDLEAKLRDWRAQPPGDAASFPAPAAHTARARFARFEVFVSLRPEPGGEWYYTLEFERPRPQR